MIAAEDTLGKLAIVEVGPLPLSRFDSLLSPEARVAAAYARGGSADARWAVISGCERFFVLTNRLHGFTAMADRSARTSGATTRPRLHPHSLRAYFEVLSQLLGLRPPTAASHPTETTNRRL